MTLFWSMLPVYLFGNFHCLGMCGPLVMMMGQNRFRYFYFLGRALAFMLAGLLAGGAGFLLELSLKPYALSAWASIGLGLWLMALGVISYLPLRWRALEKRLHRMNHSLSYLLLKETPLATFLFGFFTLLLPCGQSLLVFSACALAGSPLAGALNGAVFALLTSPSLFVAMHLTSFFKAGSQYASLIMSLTALMVGSLAVLRGLAEQDYIKHFILSPVYHIVLW